MALLIFRKTRLFSRSHQWLVCRLLVNGSGCHFSSIVGLYLLRNLVQLSSRVSSSEISLASRKFWSSRTILCRHLIHRSLCNLRLFRLAWKVDIPIRDLLLAPIPKDMLEAPLLDICEALKPSSWRQLNLSELHLLRSATWFWLMPMHWRGNLVVTWSSRAFSLRSESLCTSSVGLSIQYWSLEASFYLFCLLNGFTSPFSPGRFEFRSISQ